MTWTPIVGKRFSATEFEGYARSVVFNHFRPQFVVVHNTAMPKITDRPLGFTPQHMHNLEGFYRDQQKWSAGPHAFVDQNGIWAFTPLNVQGVHSPSWNGTSWGVETLGDYETEAFEDPIKDNLLSCLVVLHDLLTLDPQSLKLHKEDPKTTHKTCPGKHVDKSELIESLTMRLAARKASVNPAPVA